MTAFLLLSNSKPDNPKESSTNSPFLEEKTMCYWNWYIKLSQQHQCARLTSKMSTCIFQWPYHSFVKWIYFVYIGHWGMFRSTCILMKKNLNSHSRDVPKCTNSCIFQGAQIHSNLLLPKITWLTVKKKCLATWGS